MPSLNRCALIMAMGLCVSASAMAQTGAAPATSDGPLTTGGFMAWGSLGMQADVGGAVNSSGIGTIGGARSEINTNTWGERYDAALIFRFGGAYNLSPRDQVFAAFSFQQAEADTAPIGLAGGQPLDGTFTDYQGWGIDAGYRYVIDTVTTAKPFISGSIGFDRIQAISLSLSSGSFSMNEIPFYDDSWVMSWRVGTGFLWQINDRYGAHLSLDLKYSGVLSDEAGIGTVGFERINDVGNRWTLPLMAGIYVRF
jgi:hypothetical protein